MMRATSRIRSGVEREEPPNLRTFIGSVPHRVPVAPELGELPVDNFVEGAFFERAPLKLSAGPVSGEDFEALVDGADRMDMELSAADRVDDLVPQHEIPLVLLRDDHALLPRQPARLADRKEDFNFLVHAADSLNLPFLIHRTGDGDILPERNIRETRKDRINLGRRGAVSVDSPVRLLERNARVHGKGPTLGVHPVQISANDHHTLAVGGAAQAGLAFDVDNAA